MLKREGLWWVDENGNRWSRKRNRGRKRCLLTAQTVLTATAVRTVLGAQTVKTVLIVQGAVSVSTALIV